MSKKEKVLVIGAFRRTAEDDRIGGLAFACSSLVESELQQDYEFLLVDSTISSIRNQSGWRRAPSSVIRILKSLWLMTTSRVRYVVCFTSHGNSFLEKGTIAILGRCLGKRVVLFPRSGHLMNQLQSRAWMRRFGRLVVRCSWRVLCQSERWKDFYVEMYAQVGEAESRFVVLENWLRASAFVDIDEPVSSSDGTGAVVGFYNRIEKSKGIWDFVEVVDQLRKVNPQIRAIVFGDGADLDELQRLIQQRGDGAIKYGGWLDNDKKERLRELDVILFCSHAEGFPNALLETIALKVPTVATDVGAVSDMVVDEVGGFIVDVADHEAMAARVIELCGNRSLRSQFAENAYRRAVRENSLENAVQQFRELLR
ncbi:glycosyltransferase family 4 protein [Stieleria varia]|uniref:Alpha-D-kanosaminyltransferase n=1 Tax=Stieleria varia TaxID=2528005 RepID=A0A5C6AGU6_9BACT|nr:glycosyltransferase family 4 protein [Stieleria varia]TWT98626.1 Alpha-D-kanosaminyltransferase [Stieleria varia]